MQEIEKYIDGIATGKPQRISGPTIEEKLNRLAEMQAQLDAIRLHFEELREEAIPDWVYEKMREIEAEEATARESATAGINALTNEIKADVLAARVSVKGDHLQAIWTKGRVSWDTKALDGYSAAHPELLPFRKEGEPSVSIRENKR